MRIILVIASVSVANAAECALDSSGAVANGIDSALGIWASTERCKPGLGVKCEIDVASTIKSVSATASSIAGMMASCGAIDETNAQCGLAVNGLVGAAAGLASASGTIADFCALHTAGPEELHPLTTDLGKCTANTGGAVNSIFNAKNTISSMQKDCDVSGSKKCTVGILDVVSVVSDLGAHIAGSTAFCQSYAGTGGKSITEAKCAKGVLEAVSSLSAVSKIATGVSQACSASSTRLYLASGGEDAKTASLGLFAVAAVFAVTAVLSVVAGLGLAKSRQHSSARMVLPQQEAEELLESPVIQ